jgi:hypothetical protein
MNSRDEDFMKLATMCLQMLSRDVERLRFSSETHRPAVIYTNIQYLESIDTAVRRLLSLHREMLQLPMRETNPK